MRESKSSMSRADRCRPVEETGLVSFWWTRWRWLSSSSSDESLSIAASTHAQALPPMSPGVDLVEANAIPGDRRDGSASVWTGRDPRAGGAVDGD